MDYWTLCRLAFCEQRRICVLGQNDVRVLEIQKVLDLYNKKEVFDMCTRKDTLAMS